MKKAIILLLSLAIVSMLILTACQKSTSTTSEQINSPEASEDLAELNELDSFYDEMDQDISFEELDNLNLE